MMQQNTRTRKIISVIVSAIMVLTMFPLMAFTSTAATGTVYSSGDWLVPGASWNSNMNGFSNNGAQPAYSTIGLHNTNFVFMQTEDNQVMTYTVDMYGKKNAITNSAKIMWLETNYNNSADDFMALVTSEYWSSDGNNLDRWKNGSTFPQDVDMTSYGTPGHMQYTVTFTANGSAVYHPEWTMQVRTRSSGFGGYTNYEMNALNYNSEVINADPVFTIQVIDLREIRTLISMANSLNVDISDIVASRDFSGNTLYSQSEIDTMVAALRTRLLCDYTALDAQLARAAGIEENINGGLGGYLYDELLYNIFTEVYEESQDFDRFLMGNAQSENQASINEQALSLKAAIDNLLPSRIALVNYYVDGVLYGQNTVDPADGYNFHDVTHKRGDEYYVASPTKEHYEFVGWADVNGNLINENTIITADLDVYAEFTVKLNGIAPLNSSGRWDHVMGNTTDPNGDYYMWGENYVTMWVNDTTFDFMQVEDNQVFSFYTDFTAVKNQGSNYARINDVWLVDDADTNEFSSLLDSTNGIEIYCVTPNFGNGDRPSEQDLNGNGEPDGLLPGIFANNHASQMSAYFVTWRYIYAFNADGTATYNPKWNIEYVSGGQNILGDIGNTEYHLTDSGDTYVNFTINVSDARGLIKMINKAESILNNANNNFTESQKAAIRAILDDINANYVLDGSVYYSQATIDTQIERIRAYIPENYAIECDYTELDAAIALAEAKMAACNNNANNHYIDEVWQDFEDAYTAATDPSIRGLYIDGASNENNQTLIDSITAELIRALNALDYLSHVNEHTDDNALQNLVDDAVADIGTDNSNGLYDDDVWQDYIDALDNAQDIIDQDLYVDSDGNNDNQQIIDDALQDLQDAIDALNANANDPCDYTALDAAIAAAQAVGNNSDSQYTATTYEALQDAIAAGQAVPRDLYDNGTNQQTIDDAAQAINDALAALTENGLVDTTDLENAVNDAENNTPGLDNSDSQYKDDAWQDYLDALDDAHDLIDNPPYDDEAGNGQQQVDDALHALEDAIAALNDPANQNGLCDYAALDAAIDAATDLGDNSSHKYTAATFEALQDALAAAQAVERDMYDDEAGVNQGIIDDATTALADALNALVQNGLVDTTDLEDAVDDVTNNWPGLDNSDGKYDDDAWQDYLDAVDNAQDLIDNPPYDDENGEGQQLVDDALQDIIDALDALDNPANQNAPCDYTALDAAIAAAETINNSDLFTPETYQALQDALADAQAVPTGLYDDDAGNNQQTIDDAAATLNEAIANLLADAITNAGNTDTTGMTASSVQDLEDAIDDAQTVAADTNSTAGDKADAINDITGAVDGLTPDKTELEETINVAEAIDTTNIPQSLADALEDAITDGQTVDADTDATVQEIKDATDAINDVIDDILAYVIDEAENIDTTGMTPVTAANLEDAVADAQAVQNDPNATAQEKADAINALEDAIENLAPDKTELEEAITAGESIDTTDLPQSLADALEDALADGNTVDNNDDATVQEIKDATDAINDALDDILEYVIDEAENTDTTGMTDQSIQDLQDAIDHANDVLNDPDATAQDKADAIEDIQDAVDGLTPDKTELEEKIDEAENADTTGVKPEVIQDLEDAIAAAEAVDADPDATVQEIQDAIDALEDAIAALDDPNNWIELSKFVPTAAGGAYINRADSVNYYFMGIDASDTSLANIKTLLENDGRQIVAFRGETQLTDTDLIGTGCVIKCISIKDPTRVYEQATVILYGDVNGDGLINQDDYDLEFNETLFGVKIEGKVFRLAGDLNNDGVIDGFDMSKLELQMTGARPIDQIGRTLKVDVDEIDVNTVTTDGGDKAVDKAVKFTAVETEVEIAAKEYKKWDVDFAVSFNKDVSGSDVCLYGQYDAYGANWLGGELSDEQITAGTKTYLIRDWIAPYTGGAVTVNYTDIVTAVREMNTAIRVNNPADGLTVTVEFILTDADSGKTYKAAEYTYNY